MVLQLDPRKRDALPERYRSVFDFVDQLLFAADQVSDEQYAALREHYSEFEVVELCYFVLYQSIAHRFGAAMGLEVPTQTHKSVKDLYID